MSLFQQPVSTWSKEDKLVSLTSWFTFSCVTMGSLLYLVFGQALIASMYDGQSFGFFNKLIEHHRAGRPWANLEHYFTLSRLVYSRILFVCIAAQLMIVAGLKYRSVVRGIHDFFTAETHPVNLALFRIVLFYTIFHSVDIPYVTWFSQIPAELRVAPIGLGWLLDHLPINPTWARVSATLLLACSFAAMIGLFTRTSALATVILSFYVLGIPQFYGKINHYHHLLWFAAILAASRCGDALSCDGVIAAWRRADRGVTDPPGPSPIYAIPLRFVWLLLGIIYFFAGFWKFWSAGFDWALTDNLKFIMYQKWTDLGGWTPFFRVDRYPLLYKLGAIGTILFEISFVFLIFSRRLRLLAPLGGLVFHTATALFMRISFQTLLNCYVALFDWNTILGRIGRWLYRDAMYVLYDGNCRLCRRTIASLRVFDVLGRTTYLNALDKQATGDHGLHGLDSLALMKDMHVIVGKKRWAGFPAYRVLALRIPALWPAVPFLYLWPITSIATRIYRYVADSRLCTITYAATLKAPDVENRGHLSCRGVVTVGALLVFGSIFVGFADIGNAWPLAHYPTFEGIAGPEIQTIEIVVVEQGRETIPLLKESLGYDLGLSRFLGLISAVRTANDESERRLRANALWQLWTRNSLRIRQAESLRIYELTLSAIPERRSDNPIHREMLFEIKR